MPKRSHPSQVPESSRLVQVLETPPLRLGTWKVSAWSGIWKISPGQVPERSRSIQKRESFLRTRCLEHFPWSGTVQCTWKHLVKISVWSFPGQVPERSLPDQVPERYPPGQISERLPLVGYLQGLPLVVPQRCPRVQGTRLRCYSWHQAHTWASSWKPKERLWTSKRTLK
jgi:hypothetical protein